MNRKRREKKYKKEKLFLTRRFRYSEKDWTGIMSTDSGQRAHCVVDRRGTPWLDLRGRCRSGLWSEGRDAPGATRRARRFQPAAWPSDRQGRLSPSGTQSAPSGYPNSSKLRVASLLAPGTVPRFPQASRSFLFPIQFPRSRPSPNFPSPA